MKFKGWPKVSVKLDNGEITDGIAPLLISASRSTDIPALYSSWFFHRFKRGYLRWINPFNGKETFISFEQARLIIFWSKNPEPIFPYLDELNKKNINYIFQFTLNNYEDDRLEPAIPALSERISTFKKLSTLIGKEHIMWRFDPLILTDRIDVANLLQKVKKVGDQIAPYSARLTISFLTQYEKVKRNMKRYSIYPRNVTNDSIEKIGEGLQKMSKEWEIPIYSCAEPLELKKYGILHGACIDPYYLAKIFSDDFRLVNFINGDSEQVTLLEGTETVHELKDPGQRKLCRCIISKDIGRYDTCTHFCTYCYANSSEKRVQNNLKDISYTRDSLLI